MRHARQSAEHEEIEMVERRGCDANANVGRGASSGIGRSVRYSS